MDPNLQENLSLQVILDDKTIFTSLGKWLYPLFDLEEFFKQRPFDMSKVEIRDKVIGKAAALLILRLGPGFVYGEIISDLGIAVFEKANLPFSFGERVPKIACKTEELLAEVDDLDEAYQLICQQAGRC